MKINNMYYKYINPNDEKAMRFLTHNELFFSNPEKWENDSEYQFEFDKIDYEELYNDLLRIFINIYDNDKILYSYLIAYYNYLLPKGFSNSEDFEQLICYNIVMNIKNNKNQYLQELKRKYYKKTGILCLSTTPKSSTLWNYKKVDKNNCICVGLDKELLISFIKSQKNIVCKNVHYYNLDSIPRKSINNFNDENKKVLEFLEFSFSLPKNLMEEEETRIVKVFPNGVEKEDERIIIMPNNLFKEIIFSDGMDIELIEKIKCVGLEKGIINFGSQI